MRNTSLRLCCIAVFIAALGILSIYSSTFQRDSDAWKVLYTRQIFWTIVGLVLFVLFARMNYRTLWDLTYPMYGIILGLLLLVFLLGMIRLGAQRWLKLAWFSIQPSELAKIAIVIFIARYYTTKRTDTLASDMRNLGVTKALLLPMVLVLVPVGLIIEQPDLGSGLIVFIIFLLMIFITDIKMRYLVSLGLILLACLPIGWHFLRGYQKDRILVFLNPNIDPLGAGYTIIQSKIAIGSAGLFGKGWLAGTQNQLRFLPESHTDFIFATFIEERGIAGGILLIVLYYLLILEGLRIASRTREPFGRLLANGISIMLAVQVCINISMNMGLAPVVGVPLPLMSYGGSSLIVTFMALGMLASISRA